MAYAVLLSEQAKEEIATIKKSGDKPTIKIHDAEVYVAVISLRSHYGQK